MIVNAGNDAVAVPSLTLIVMLANVPAAVGVPWSRPVLAVNVAHAGRFTIENVRGLLFGSLAVGVNVYNVPTCPDVGGEPEITGGEFGAAATVIVNAGNDAVAVPSLTLIVMFANVPAAVGVPWSRPVVVLNVVAHAGRFTIENVNGSLFGSLAVGVYEYIVPTCPDVGGDPEITGGELGAAATVIVNAGNDAVAVPSLTLIVMFANVPAAVGVPCSRPVLAVNVAHAGRFTIENVRGLLFGSLAVGVNVYIVPTCPDVGGDPEITGGELGAAATVIVNAGNDAVAVPSLTLIVMFANVPAAVGVPWSRPVVVLKVVAHAGRFTIENVNGLLFGSLAVGVNVYIVPTCPDVGGDPEITGGEFGAAATVIVNAGNDAIAVPSLTLIVMFANVPAAVGVPWSAPVLVLNEAHAGRFPIENVNGSLFGSLALGVNEYIVPT